MGDFFKRVGDFDVILMSCSHLGVYGQSQLSIIINI